MFYDIKGIMHFVLFRYNLLQCLIMNKKSKKICVHKKTCCNKLYSLFLQHGRFLLPYNLVLCKQIHVRHIRPSTN